MKNTKTVLALALAGLISVSNAVLAGGFMPADAVTKLFSGKTANGQHLKKGFSYKVYFNANGKFVQARNDGSRLVGTWRVKGNGAHCIQFSHKNREFCRKVRDDGNGTYIKVKKKGFGKKVDVVKLWNFVPGDKTK